MRRREFITLVGGAVGWPLIAHAQESATPVIGFLNGASPEVYAPYVAAFRQGLKEAGYIDGQNVAIEYRWAEGHYERLPALAADFVRRRVSVIAATSTPTNLVAKAATSTIPIVFTTAGDPVKLGLVASLSRPGGNVTGVTQLTGEIVPKRLEFLHELVPAGTVMALLVNPADPALAESALEETKSAARKLGLELHILHAGTECDFDTVFEKLMQLRASGLVISPGAFFINRSKQLAALALRHLVPAISGYRQFVAAGGLASYAGDLTESYRLAGIYTGRILMGDKPANLPVQQVTKIELFINLKTAKALGITVPQTLQVAADEVIE
jgi:putative ABC transport system substrate-binding protein